MIPAPLTAMLDMLEPGPLVELERALRHRLAERPPLSEARVRELGFLASLLDEQAAGSAAEVVVRVPRLVYDGRRPPKSPESRLLVERYGSWLNACRAAISLHPDGRRIGPSLPWPQAQRGRRRITWTREDVREAIRRCARELDRRPSSNAYQSWRAHIMRIARGNGSVYAQRLPSLNAIYRLYPRGENRWQLAVDDAGLADTWEDSAADSAWLGLPLSQAAAVAQRERVSLEWLAGLTAERGSPPARAELHFDAEEFTRRYRARGLRYSDIRDALGLALGPYRRLVSGREEPRLCQLAHVAALLQCRVEALLNSRA